MAISEDTTALVAAQLTLAWATRMGPASYDEQGSVGPRLVKVYETIRDDLAGRAAKLRDEQNARYAETWAAGLGEG